MSNVVFLLNVSWVASIFTVWCILNENSWNVAVIVAAEEKLNRKTTLNYIPINGKNSCVSVLFELNAKMFTLICFAVGMKIVLELITEIDEK